jgi:hypothetical protein
VSLVLSPSRLDAERVRNLWASQELPSSTNRLHRATKVSQNALLSSAQKMLISSDTLEKLEGTSSHLADWADSEEVRQQEQQQPQEQLYAERQLYANEIFSIDSDTHMPVIHQTSAQSPLYSVYYEDEEQEQEQEQEQGQVLGEDCREADKDPPTTVFAAVSHMQPNNSSNTLTHAEKDDLLQSLVEENARLKAKINDVVETAAAALQEAERLNVCTKKDYDRQLARQERDNMSLRVENATLKKQAEALQERLAREEAEVMKAARLINKFKYCTGS